MIYSLYLKNLFRLTAIENNAINNKLTNILTYFCTYV